jgi:hypothetical protein
MQIRERATTWAFIRTTYDPGKKRGVARCLGTLSKSADRLPEALAIVMSDREREQAQSLLAKVRSLRDAERQAHYARVLPAAIDFATMWYLDPSNKPSAAQAHDTREAFSRLLAAMVKAGVGRKRARKRGGNDSAARKGKSSA